jgi:hypothetical protein
VSPFGIRPRSLIALAFIVGTFGGFATTPAARAHVSFSSYVRHSPAFGTLHEPINLLFTINGTNANTETHIGHHDWNTFVCAGTLYFYDHGVFEAHDKTMATGGYCDAVRNHIRTNEQLDSGGAGFGTFSMGAAHFEDRPGGCYGASHRVGPNGFNSARDDLGANFSAGGHISDSYYLGNTDLYVQSCDGMSAQSDGWAYRLVIP